ncbi:MAG: hypothetical protein JNL79_36185 [Myxococcales bacterium]|nr:hypothetical protein [Myxococcales bacterium]
MIETRRFPVIVPSDPTRRTSGSRWVNVSVKFTRKVVPSVEVPTNLAAIPGPSPSTALSVHAVTQPPSASATTGFAASSGEASAANDVLTSEATPFESNFVSRSRQGLSSANATAKPPAGSAATV